MTEREEIIAAAGTIPENRYVNFLFYQMASRLPASITLSAGNALPEVIDLESNAPIETDFKSVRTRLKQIAPEGTASLTMCGKPYSLRIESPDDHTTVVEMTQ